MASGRGRAGRLALSLFPCLAWKEVSDTCSLSLLLLPAFPTSLEYLEIDP